MPRRKRHFKSDAIFHLGARGVDRQPIFLTDGDREFFVCRMQENLRASNLKTVAWCLMPNHFHWGVATADERFERAVHDTLTAHAVRFNRLHGRTGHLFEDRHWSTCCEDLNHVENMVAYIHLNPVRAKIVRRPEEWRWSSMGDWRKGASGDVDFVRVAELTGHRAEDLIRAHSERIAMELAVGPRGLSPDELIDDIASMLGISRLKLRANSTTEEYRLARRVLLERAEKESISIKNLALHLGCTPETLYIMRRTLLKKVPDPSFS